MTFWPTLICLMNFAIPGSIHEDSVAVTVLGQVSFPPNFERIGEISLRLVEPRPRIPRSFEYKPTSQGAFRIEFTSSQLADLGNPIAIKLQISCGGYKVADLKIGPIEYSNTGYVERVEQVQLKPILCPVTVSTNLENRGGQLVLREREPHGRPILRIILQNRSERNLVFTEIAVKSEILEKFLGRKHTDLAEIESTDVRIDYKVDSITFIPKSYQFAKQGVGQFNFILVPAGLPKTKLDTRVWIQLRSTDDGYVWIGPFRLSF